MQVYYRFTFFLLVLGVAVGSPIVVCCGSSVGGLEDKVDLRLLFDTNWLRRLPGVPIWPNFSTILSKNRTGRADVLDEGCNRPAVATVDDVDVNDGVGWLSVMD